MWGIAAGGVGLPGKVMDFHFVGKSLKEFCQFAFKLCKDLGCGSAPPGYRWSGMAGTERV
jgi:hypothetical protein